MFKDKLEKEPSGPMHNIYLYLGQQAVEELVHYCQEKGYTRFMLVADGNTYPALGRRVEEALEAQNWDVKSVVFREPEVTPDEASIFQVLYRVEDEERTYLAVGTGTLTDIARFCSHRTRRPFISLPTAPSVDGFTSPSASISIGRVKTTVIAKPPEAVIADLPTLARAPQAMIAAGFGDILGKAIALADWKLGQLLWDEPYSVEIAARVRKTLDGVLAAAPEIGRATPEGIEKLMAGLGDSGLCMLDFGNSRPAAGCEHYMSHFLEMKLLRERRPAVLHGAKVALCSILAANYYARLRGISRAEAEHRLELAALPAREDEVAVIRASYPDIADRVIAEMGPFLNMTGADFERLKTRILSQWDGIQELAAQVPSPDRLKDYLRMVGGQTEPGGLGLSDAEVHLALQVAHYFRNRFSVCKLARILDFADKE
jgi:glycerol-1-phosphate dehydrogenase [NAD(P)+]